LLVLVVLMPATTSAGAGPRTGTPSELFVLTAADVRLSHASGKGNAFELVLDRPAGSVSGFSDRPQRLLSRRSLGGFVRAWGNLGFRSDPPNAALVVDHAPSSADVFVFELSRPALGAGGRTLTFDARALERRPTGILARVARGADTARAGGFGRGSLFIDGSGQAASLVFSFTALSTESQGGAVTFTNATITDADVSVPSQQAGAFAEAAVDSTSFQLGSNGNGPFSATITVDVEVDSGATSLNGTATVPQGGSGTVSVEEGPTRTLQFGNFSLPLS
jgi:hypothetical protein